MMEFEMFKELVIEKLGDYFPEETKVKSITTRPVKKVNQSLTGITLDSSELVVTPTVYMEDLYDRYVRSDDLEGTLRDAAMLLATSKPEFDIPTITKLDEVRDKIIAQVVNREQNAEMLETVPHRDMLDLAVVYRVIVSDTRSGFATSMITNDLMKTYGVNEKELYDLAVQNIREVMKPRCMNLNDVMRKMFKNDGMPDDVIDMIMTDGEKEDALYVITNKNGVNGASTILCDEILHDLANEIGSNIYILPSSVHEVLAISAKNASPDDLADLVGSVNFDVVDIKDRLSNAVYEYDRDTRKLSIASSGVVPSIANEPAEKEPDKEPKKKDDKKH